MKKASHTLQGLLLFLMLLLMISLVVYKNPDLGLDFNKITGAVSITGSAIRNIEFMSGDAYGVQACMPPIHGDWIINRRVVCKDKTIIVDGNLIFNGGELIFFNGTYINVKTNEIRHGYFKIRA